MIGSAWGIVEATVGHFIHVFTLGIGCLLWFPIAFFFLNSVYRMTKKTSCMIYTAFLAAGIKMLDIFYTPRYDYVINPAVSILFEALAVFAVYQILMKRNQQVKLDIPSILIACIGWKVLYICYLLFLPDSWINISCLSGMIPFAKFLFQETIMNTLFISAFVVALQNLPKVRIDLFGKFETAFSNRKILAPSLSCLMLLLAVLVQIKL
jgi:hypothetical protein